MTTPKVTDVLGRLLAGTQREEIDCDTFAEHLPGWIEGRSPAALHDALQQHLEICPECEEERALLVQAIGALSSDNGAGDGASDGPGDEPCS